MCLICASDESGKEISLCTACASSPVTTDEWNHELSHSVVKARQFIRDRDKAALYSTGRKLVRQWQRTEARTKIGHGATTRHIGQLGEDYAIDVIAQTELACSCCSTPLVGFFWMCLTCGKDQNPIP